MSGKNERHSWYATALLSSGHFFSDFYANFLPVLLPLIMPKLGMSLTMSGLLVMVLSFTSNVFQPFFGYLMDKKNLNWLLLFVVPGSAVFICSTGLAETKTALFILVALSGVAVSIFHPLGSSLIGKVAGGSRLGVSVSLFVAGGNLGFALAPIIIVSFTQSYGLTALPLLMIPSFILAALYYISKLYKPRLRVVPGDRRAPNLARLIRQPELIRLNVAMGMRAWTHVAWTTFLPALLVLNGRDATYAGFMLTVFLSGSVAGGLLGGYFTDRIGLKKVIVVSLALGVIPTCLFFIDPENTAASLLWLFLSGAGLQAASPGSLIWAQKLLPRNQGMASGMMLGLSFGFGGVGAALTGALADFIGLSASLLLTAAPLALAALVTWTIPDPKERTRSGAFLNN